MKTNTEWDYVCAFNAANAANYVGEDHYNVIIDERYTINNIIELIDLSAEAKAFVKMLFEAPAEFMSLITTPKQGKISPRKIKQYLKDRYGSKKSKAILDEVKTLID